MEAERVGGGGHLTAMTKGAGEWPAPRHLAERNLGTQVLQPHSPPNLWSLPGPPLAKPNLKPVGIEGFGLAH